MVYVHVKMHIQNDIKKQTIIRYQYPSVYIPKSLYTPEPKFNYFESLPREKRYNILVYFFFLFVIIWHQPCIQSVGIKHRIK